MQPPGRTTSVFRQMEGASFMALASSGAPVAEARHEPNADRDLDIYELDLSSGTRTAVVEASGDDFAPSVANGFLYWMHNDIHDSVVVFPHPAARLGRGGLAEIPYWSPDGKQISFTYGPWRLADWALNLDAALSMWMRRLDPNRK